MIHQWNNSQREARDKTMTRLMKVRDRAYEEPGKMRWKEASSEVEL
jgi:hypothetical protein